MADDKTMTNSIGRTAVTAVVSAVIGALLMVMMNSKASEGAIARNSTDIGELKTRILAVELAGAAQKEKLQAVESKVDDIWKVVVLGERVAAKR